MSAEKMLTKIKGSKFCRLEVSLTDGRLSICGTAGDVLRPAMARKEALEYWRSYFEDQPGEIFAMNERCGSKCRTPGGAARYVVNSDGELHGLDVVSEDSDRVLVSHSAGQIVEELREWFPEVSPYLPHHLNDLKAGCVHQDALGWGHGRDVALAAADCTPAQRATLEASERAAGNKRRADEYLKRRERLGTDRAYRQEILKAIGRPDVSAWESLESMLNRGESLNADRALMAKVRDEIQRQIAIDLPDYSIRSEIFKDSNNAPCPECGYRYGSQWLKRELPAEVIAWFESLPTEKTIVVRKEAA